MMEQIDLLFRGGYEAQVFLREMTRHMRALLIVKVVKEGAAALLQITEEDEQRYRKQTKKFTQERLIRIMNGFMTADSELRYASSPRIGLEIAALKACREETGEDYTALTERIAELELKVRELPEAAAEQRQKAPKGGDLQSAAPEDSARVTPSPPADLTAEPVMPERPAGKADTRQETQDAVQNEDEIWKSALKLLAATEPVLCGLIKRERFIGAKGNVFTVQVPQERMGFSFASLKKRDKLDLVSKALSDAAGRPMLFDVVLEGAAEQKASVRENIQTLAETVGRDLLQIDETGD